MKFIYSDGIYCDVIYSNSKNSLYLVHIVFWLCEENYFNAKRSVSILDSICIFSQNNVFIVQ